MNSKTVNKSGFAASVLDALFGDIAPNQIDWLRARFAERGLERDYRQNLIDNELPKERLINYLSVFVYAAFSILDIITFDDLLPEVLTLRLAICTPIAFCLILLTHIKQIKPFFQYITAAVLLIGAGSIVLMIAMMGPDGGPPYIVGILTVFIVYSCLQRLDFPLAAVIYILIFAAYSATIVIISPKSGTEIAAGHFFMTTITLTALLTSYVQELRSRLDFSRRRQREIDAAYIEELLIEATVADRAKISFLSTLSHEMRTPLHQIVGFSEVVRNQLTQGAESNTSDYLGEIHTSATGLLTTIGKILRYADATAGKVSYDLDACAIQYLVETIADQAFMKAEENTVALKHDDVEPATLHIDHLHTAYALGHLIDNAIAASAPGSVVEIHGAREDGGGYVLAIRDHGRGMTGEQLKGALTPFTQTESYKTRCGKGVGIGLTLAKKILEDQGAAMTMTSSPSRGTTVCVHFPTAPDRRAIDEAETQPPQAERAQTP